MRNLSETQKTTEDQFAESRAFTSMSSTHAEGFPLQAAPFSTADAMVGYPEMGQYADKGVYLTASGNTWILTYRGILAKSGACEVYAVVNKGSNTNWKDVRFYPMGLTDNHSTFQMVFPRGAAPEIHIAFKDGADHWDNNAGKNYSYTDLPEIM